MVIDFATVVVVFFAAVTEPVLLFAGFSAAASSVVASPDAVTPAPIRSSSAVILSFAILFSARACLLADAAPLVFTNIISANAMAPALTQVSLSMGEYSGSRGPKVSPRVPCTGRSACAERPFSQVSAAAHHQLGAGRRRRIVDELEPAIGERHALRAIGAAPRERFGTRRLPHRAIEAEQHVVELVS